MNNILNYGGFRFFQSSYDKDEKGTVLSVNHDKWGTIVTYIGYIFLAVEKNGEAYYYYPVDKKGYYLGRPADAFNIMRTLGLGATHDFIQNTTYFPTSVSGKILLDVESHGEAYYIYPKDRKKYYLGRPDDAFVVMRNLGLGITNANLSVLPLAQ